MKPVSLTPSQDQDCTKTKRPLSQLVPLPWLLLTICWGLLAVFTSQPLSALAPSLEPLDIKLLAQDVLPPERDIITANTISQVGIATPSLWWAKEQFDEFDGSFITNWIAYQNKKRVDLVVNRQLWSLLDYMGRYRFVNKFGTVARDYNYDVRVFNQQAALLATYTCDYSKTPPDCEIIVFKSFGQDSLQVPRQ